MFDGNVITGGVFNINFAPTKKIQWKAQIMAQSASVGDSSLKVTAAKNHPVDDVILY